MGARRTPLERGAEDSEELVLRVLGARHRPHRLEEVRVGEVPGGEVAREPERPDEVAAAARIADALGGTDAAAGARGPTTRSTWGRTRQEVTPWGIPWRDPSRLPRVWERPRAAGPGRR